MHFNNPWKIGLYFHIHDNYGEIDLREGYNMEKIFKTEFKNEKTLPLWIFDKLVKRKLKDERQKK
jgi:hypothetical protein